MPAVLLRPQFSLDLLLFTHILHEFLHVVYMISPVVAME